MRLREGSAALRRAVELVDDRAEPVEQPTLEIDGAGRGGVDHLPQRRDVVARADLVGQLHEAVELRGDHRHVGDAVALHELQGALGIPLVHEHDRVLEVQREEPERQRRHVVHRRRHQVDRVAADFDVVAGQVRGERRDLGLGIHRDRRALHRFGPAGGPRGVLQELTPRALVRKVAGLDVERVREPNEALDLADAETRVGRYARRPGRRGRDARAALIGHERGRVRVAEDEGDLVGGEVRVQGYIGPTRLEHGEQGLQQLGAIRGERGDGVAGAHTARPERVHELVGAAQQVARAPHLFVRVDHRDARRVGRRRRPESPRRVAHPVPVDSTRIACERSEVRGASPASARLARTASATIVSVGP